jgi:4-phosphopantoate--beta-alanine ligase
MQKNGAKEVLGIIKKNSRRISGLDSARRIVDKDGIYIADVVLVPLEDGDRTIALKKAGKKVITFDLNPLSRTSQTADITIVDNVVRGIGELTDTCTKMQGKKLRSVKFDNKKNLAESISEIRNYLEKRAKIA